MLNKDLTFSSLILDHKKPDKNLLQCVKDRDHIKNKNAKNITLLRQGQSLDTAAVQKGHY